MQSWQIFSYALKTLPKGFLQKLYTRSYNLIQLWAADPAFNDRQARNPIDRITIMLRELDLAGYGHVARAAVDLMAGSMGGCFAPLPGAVSDKGSVDGEAAVALGELVKKCREAVDDGVVDEAELHGVMEQLRATREEIEQLFDAVRQRRAGGI